MNKTALDVLEFWRASGEKKWWAANPAFDAEIKTRFHALHQDAADGQLDDWCDKAETALALVIILDQFSRNIYRGEAGAFACDEKAREIARRSIAQGFDLDYDGPDRIWFYTPFEHSESVEDQALSVRYFTERTTTSPSNLKFIEDHAQIIERFGRFPHRNAILGRANTAPEDAYLAENKNVGWGQTPKNQLEQTN